MTLTATRSTTFVKLPTAVTAEIDGQLVALDINAGVCYGLNEVATDVWKLLNSHPTVPELTQALLEVYDIDAETCAEETDILLQELVASGLITSD